MRTFEEWVLAITESKNGIVPEFMLKGKKKEEGDKAEKKEEKKEKEWKKK